MQKVYKSLILYEDMQQNWKKKIKNWRTLDFKIFEIVKLNLRIMNGEIVKLLLFVCMLLTEWMNC